MTISRLPIPFPVAYGVQWLSPLPSIILLVLAEH